MLHTATEGPAFDFHVSDAEPVSHFSVSFLLELQTKIKKMIRIVLLYTTVYMSQKVFKTEQV